MKRKEIEEMKKKKKQQRETIRIAAFVYFDLLYADAMKYWPDTV